MYKINIKKIVFDGLEGVELLTSNWRMVAITECGPRIAFLGQVGSDSNILYWNKDGGSRGDWKLYGGHRVWITRPYADESEDTYMADNEPCDVIFENNSITIFSPPHHFAKISRGMKIDIIDDDTFSVTNMLRNDGDFIYSGGVWSPTCINPIDKIIEIPLGEDDSTWDIVKIIIPRKFAQNTVRINDPQITFSDDSMIIKSQGILTKRCVCAPKGKIIMNWESEGIRFTKYSKYIRDGKYPLDGCNIGVFIGKDNWMGEMESFGVEQSIRPGETISNQEKWVLLKV